MGTCGQEFFAQLSANLWIVTVALLTVGLVGVFGTVAWKMIRG